jgi:DNA ligase (NAD+)
MTFNQLLIPTLSEAELEAAIVEHNRKYWELNEPEITDAQFDLLVRELTARKPDSPVLARVPTSTISGEKVRHGAPMLSLDKCYSAEELDRWFARIEGAAIATQKIDGLAVSLRYDGAGRLALAATRGDGETGELVTANMLMVGGVPSQVAAANIEVRGEAYMPVSTFSARYAEAFANPRNLAAGALKQKDPAKTEAYGLHFLAYDLQGDPTVTTEAEEMERLRALGFTVSPYQVCDREEGQRVFESLAATRSELDYETDGIVFKVNDLAIQHGLGNTAHHPRGAIAYKYQGESGLSELTGIEWSVSRTGAINPVALVAPVFLSGVTVSRVSLHNLSIMAKLAGEAPLAVGAQVAVTRRGGVIPHIESVLKPGAGALLLPPAACPSCGAPAEVREDILMADHAPTCTGAASRRLLHVASALDLDGFGPKLVEQLFAAGLLAEPADFYALTADKLMSLERLGEKTAANLLASIETRRTLRFASFLNALGAPEVGEQLSRDLEAHFDSLESLLDANADQLTAIAGVGPRVSSAILGFVAEHRPWIERLAACVTFTWPPKSAAGGPLAGKKFVFTGSLASMSREAAQEQVRSLGGATPSTVSGEVDFLVVGDADYDKMVAGKVSSKLKKAMGLREAGGRILIVPERDFLPMLTPDSPSA